MRCGSGELHRVVWPLNPGHAFSRSWLSLSHPMLVWRHGRIPHPVNNNAATLSINRTSFTNFFIFTRSVPSKQSRGRVIMKSADAARFVIPGLLLRDEPREVWM